MSKSPQAFRSISEAAEEVGVPQHVLRFWETKFDFVTPVKRAGGRRFYRPDDIETLKLVRRLLHDDGLTIKGVQRFYKDRGKTLLSVSTDDSVVIDVQVHEIDHVAASRRIDTRGIDLAGLLSQIEAAEARLQTALRR